jgi:hypothetical protein
MATSTNTNGPGSEPDQPTVSALAINVAVPEDLQWTDVRRGTEFRLTSITVRLLPDSTLAAKAYGRPVEGGRGGYVSFAVPDSPEIRHLIESAASIAGSRWDGHREWA